jgi:hypothetical protein
LANALTDILNGLLIRKLGGDHFGRRLILWSFLGNQVLHALGQRTDAAAAIAGAGAILDQSAGLAANNFPIHFQRVQHGLFFGL